MRGVGREIDSFLCVIHVTGLCFTVTYPYLLWGQHLLGCGHRHATQSRIPQGFSEIQTEDVFMRLPTHVHTEHYIPQSCIHTCTYMHPSAPHPQHICMHVYTHTHAHTHTHTHTRVTISHHYWRKWYAKSRIKRGNVSVPAECLTFGLCQTSLQTCGLKQPKTTSREAEARNQPKSKKSQTREINHSQDITCVTDGYNNRDLHCQQ